jgi:hypothetical protein
MHTTTMSTIDDDQCYCTSKHGHRKIKYSSMREARLAEPGYYVYACPLSDQRDPHFHASNKRAEIEWQPQLPFIEPFRATRSGKNFIERELSQIMRIRIVVANAMRAGLIVARVRPKDVSHEAWEFWRSCLRKRAFVTRDEAEATLLCGVRAYECNFCKLFHRTKQGKQVDQLVWRANGDKCEVLRNGEVIACEHAADSIDDQEQQRDDATESASQWDSFELL